MQNAKHRPLWPYLNAQSEAHEKCAAKEKACTSASCEWTYDTSTIPMTVRPVVFLRAMCPTWSPSDFLLADSLANWLVAHALRNVSFRLTRMVAILMGTSVDGPSDQLRGMPLIDTRAQMVSRRRWVSAEVLGREDARDACWKGEGMIGLGRHWAVRIWKASDGTPVLECLSSKSFLYRYIVNQGLRRPDLLIMLRREDALFRGHVLGNS